MKIADTARKYYVNLRGWSTDDKIIVIESDDWGSIRMQNKSAVRRLQEEGVPLQENKFTLYDGLEKQEDLECLFDVLSKVKGSNQLPAVITPLVLVANPSFEAIEKNRFTFYEWQDLKNTYSKYDENRLLQLWIKEGINNNFFYPQFHGREHLHPYRWMKALQDPNSIARKGFEKNSILGLKDEKKSQSDNYMAAFEAISRKEQGVVNQAIKEGLDLFKTTFGFDSLSAMPSQSIITEESKAILKQQGVKYLQCGQHFSSVERGLNRRDYWWGYEDSLGLRYWRRNCTFEPYKDDNRDHVDQCLKEISIAFRCGKPAVISSHRINYTSRITCSIRDKALTDLSKLLQAVIKKWPEVEFLSSHQLSIRLDEAIRHQKKQ